MAAARRAILVVNAWVVFIGRLLLLRGRGARTPLRLLLVWNNIIMVGLGLVGVARREPLAIEGLYGRVGRIIGLGGIDGLDVWVSGNGRRGRLVGRVLGLKVGVVWIGPRLVLRWGRGVEGLTRVGGWWGEIGVRGVGTIMKIDGRVRVVLLASRVRVLILGVCGWCWRVVLGG